LTASVRSRSSAVADFLRREIALGSFPGAAWAAGSAEGIECEGAVGNGVAVPLRIPADVETIYDCASITKAIITTTLLLQAVAEDVITLDDSFQGYTYRELLTHTSGLRAWLPLYAYDDYLAAALEHGPEVPRGTKVIYSDLNFVLLWYALREMYGDFAAAVRTQIFEPLGLRDAYMAPPPPALRPRIAATEWGQRYEMKMCAAQKIAFNGARDGLIWGQTHDGNSHYAGGTAGNAGLFATARDVFRLAQSWARAELLPRALVAEASSNCTPTLPTARGLGWDKPTAGSEATSMLSSAAYGHTGFTGTSVWIDGARIFVLLTNRVHPCAAPVAMQRVRGEFHRLAF
jgi:CubicO group peptidase (beta-lactamase class C family)